MKLTDEQRAIVDHQGNARVNACAGSGKTSTCLEYIKARPRANCLYLAFNSTVKTEAIKKFKRAGLGNVTVHTAHSLAYQSVVSGRDYELHKSGNLRPYDVTAWYKPSVKFKDELEPLVFAKHVCDLTKAYCNSDKEKIHHLDYYGMVKDCPQAREFVGRYLDEIEDAAEDILRRMWAGQLPITHDSYIKKYHLTSPDLSCYTHILFDEGQDSNPCQLAIFLNQHRSTKVIVGDTHQSIYGFNGAIDSLAKVNFPLFRLSASFRFGERIAETAMEALSLKKLLGVSLDGFTVRGLGRKEDHGLPVQAFIARSNLGLLTEAIEIVVERNQKAAFEGDLSSYTFLAGGASIFDVLNLYLGRNEKIRDSFLRKFESYDELKEYQAGTKDQDLGLVMNLVERYRGSLFPLIKELKERAVRKEEAEYLFSTVHRAKGLEYSTVRLCKDLITGEKIMQKLATAKNDPSKPVDRAALVEDINALYVAVTRATRLLLYDFAIVHNPGGYNPPKPQGRFLQASLGWGRR
ncbi:hypothetical protein A2G06_16890 (plasmid) [Geobacter anodireducens]|nr:hypothetical protein A2G06_16890 [Geobacter anodireducens]